MILTPPAEQCPGENHQLFQLLEPLLCPGLSPFSLPVAGVQLYLTFMPSSPPKMSAARLQWSAGEASRVRLLPFVSWACIYELANCRERRGAVLAAGL